MKIRIKEFRGESVTAGFFPEAGVKIKGRRKTRTPTGEYEEIPADIYECKSQDQFEACLATDLVEAVVEKKKPGRKPNEQDQSGE